MLEVDLHGYTLPCAIKKLQRTIVDNPDCRIIVAIHGFNNGNIIKDALSDYRCIHNKRVIKTILEPFNNGRTWIYLKLKRN